MLSKIIYTATCFIAGYKLKEFLSDEEKKEALEQKMLYELPKYLDKIQDKSFAFLDKVEEKFSKNV